MSLEICCHIMHEDDSDVSAGHHLKNTLHRSECLRKDFTLLETMKADSSHIHINFRDEEWHLLVIKYTGFIHIYLG